MTNYTDTYDKILELLGNYDEIGRGYAHTYCVFHDDNKKSLMVFPDARGYTSGFYCLSGECGRKGSLQELLRVLEGAPPRPRGDSKKGKPPYLPTDLSDLSKLVNDAHLALLDEDAPERRHYTKKRGLENMILPARLGWYRGWITVPIHNQAASFLGCYARATPLEEQRTGQRFHQPLSQKPMFYVPDWNIVLSASSVVVVFGMMDTLTLSLLRLPVTTTTGGSNSFDSNWLSQFRKPIVIVPDASGDDKAAIDLAAQLGWRAKILRLPYDDQVRDPADYAEYGRLDELQEELGKSE